MEKIKTEFKAFTLAEVLITLGIIGIIAAITIPTLVKNYQDAQYKSAYKKAYSALSQAFLKASQEGDIVPMTGTYSSQGSEANFAAIKKQFIVSKECEKTELSKCWDITGEKWNLEGSDVPSFVDNSGVAWRLRQQDSTNVIPLIFVDTNGMKKPNKYGQDRFMFLFSNGANVVLSKSSVFASYSTNADFIAGGQPIKMIPFFDVTIDNATNIKYCPSLATQPCYFTSWLLGE